MNEGTYDGFSTESWAVACDDCKAEFEVDEETVSPVCPRCHRPVFSDSYDGFGRWVMTGRGLVMRIKRIEYEVCAQKQDGSMLTLGRWTVYSESAFGKRLSRAG